MITIYTPYDRQAEEFLTATGVAMMAEYVDHRRYFPNDTQTRDIYQITFTRGERSITLDFGQSLIATRDGIEPTAYDVLSCMQKHDPGTFEEFCADTGYCLDSRSAYATYQAVREQYRDVCAIWSEPEVEMLREIQ